MQRSIRAKTTSRLRAKTGLALILMGSVALLSCARNPVSGRPMAEMAANFRENRPASASPALKVFYAGWLRTQSKDQRSASFLNRVECLFPGTATFHPNTDTCVRHRGQ